MGNGLENQKTFPFPSQKKFSETGSAPLPGQRYVGLNKSTLDFIVKLTETNFFGTVEIKFDGGKVVHINQTRSIKP
jgi:hypothetical protein